MTGRVSSVTDPIPDISTAQRASTSVSSRSWPAAERRRSPTNLPAVGDPGSYPDRSHVEHHGLPPRRFRASNWPPTPRRSTSPPPSVRGLTKAAVAAVVDGARRTSTRSLPDGAVVSIVTADTDEGRHVLRHSTAHVMAQAVTQLFPGAKFSIGPAIENGFYYDFELPGGATFSDDDLERIEAEHARDHQGRPAVRALRDVDRRGAGAVRRPAVQVRDHRARRVGPGRRSRRQRGLGGGRRGRHHQRLPQHRTFVDLCVGPHVPSTGKLGHFKLQKVCGRLLARQREGPDAAAHLRHGVGVQGGARRAPPPLGGGGQARPPQARRPSSTCSASRTSSAAASPCGTPRVPSCAS